jgi:hypothetical protein
MYGIPTAEADAVCTDCGHDIFLDEEGEHENCDVNITALIEDARAVREAEVEVEVMQHAA